MAMVYDERGRDPHYLRQRADSLRHTMRGLLDQRALAELERFISELEARADELSARPYDFEKVGCSERQRIMSIAGHVAKSAPSPATPF